MRTILLATGNPGKAREMREILGGAETAGSATGWPAAVEWRCLSEFASEGWPEPIEDGETFAANAEIKARHYARLSGLWTIADDSGLVVDALGSEPGVRSARYAGEPKSDGANNALLVSRLAGVPAERRTARFCCAAVLVGAWDGPRECGTGKMPVPHEESPTGGMPVPEGESLTGKMPVPQEVPVPQLRVLASAEGAVEGLIVDEPRGANGFGYDPHFWVPAFGMTTAEMSPETKHAISHRGQALRCLREQLTGLVG
ncbi:MAG: non-canonical purine NTP pyrophosphatase [Planctomycetes bacterium]|nr:non-canonical purine NTP pyrophosphatase [Planctomycetota bacterium]